MVRNLILAKLTLPIGETSFKLQEFNDVNYKGYIDQYGKAFGFGIATADQTFEGTFKDNKLHGTGK